MKGFREQTQEAPEMQTDWFVWRKTRENLTGAKDAEGCRLFTKLVFEPMVIDAPIEVNKIDLRA